jgi:hypothetical protein
MSAASQEARAGAERRRWFAAASAAVERRQASAPSLPFRTREAKEIRRAAASVDADGRFTRLSAFRLPDFMSGRDRDGAGTTAGGHPTGSGRGFRASWSKTRARTRRENASAWSLPAPAQQSISRQRDDPHPSACAGSARAAGAPPGDGWRRAMNHGRTPRIKLGLEWRSSRQGGSAKRHPPFQWIEPAGLRLRRGKAIACAGRILERCRQCLTE